jgi:4-alpha-glucanotransferase
MLPINPIDNSFSPYSSVSAFACEPLYIDLQDLLAQGLLEPCDLENQPDSQCCKTDYNAARNYRQVRWWKAFERFQEKHGGEKFANEYENFLNENQWVRRYATFMALTEHYGTQDWTQWHEEPIRRCDPGALSVIEEKLAVRIAYHVFLQLVLDVQWRELRSYCNERGIGLIGDIPIYVSARSADTWAAPHLFQLDDDGKMEYVAGVPGDDFNPDGQRWNAPLYRWDVHKEQGYVWWLARFRNTLKHFDAVRLDHFIGFYNYFSMPPEPSPDNEGHWIVQPQDELFERVFETMPHAQFIAEDLGVMNDGVAALRNKFNFPGMEVFQFSFDFYRSDDPTTVWQQNSVVCTGTHDTPPLSTWLEEILHDQQLEQHRYNTGAILWILRSFIGGTEEWKNRFGHLPLPDGRNRECSPPPENIDRYALLRAMVEMTMYSPGNTAIFPMQDIIGAGPESRMNYPGHVDNNWCWRLNESELTNELADKFAYLTWLYGRK